MDFMNMLERERLTSKKVSKTQSVQSQMRKKLDKQNIHIGPSDHVPWLEIVSGRRSGSRARRSETCR